MNRDDNTLRDLTVKWLEDDFAVLVERGSMFGPTLNVEQWRAAMKGRGREAGVRVFTGIVADGRPWAAIPERFSETLYRLGLVESRHGIAYLMEGAAQRHPA